MKDPLQGIINKQMLILELRRGFRCDSIERCVEILNRQSDNSSPRSPVLRDSLPPSTPERDER